MPSDNEPIPVARAVRKAPTASRLPPPGKKFPCPSCGARLDFDPSVRGLACPYCGFKEEIEKADGEVAERDYFAYLDKLKDAKAQTIAGHANETKCSGCGATVILEDNVAADKCPF